MDILLGRYKNLIVLAAILFAQIIALAIQVKRPAQDGETRLIRLWAISAVTPFEKAIVHTQTWAHDKWNGYIYLQHVRNENEQLRDEIDRMKLEQARLREDADMARRIQVLLAFKEQYVDNTAAAQVIGTSGSEQSRVLYIDKGSSDGIKQDMAVITPTGIVGKIVQVSSGTAQVLPINDQLSGVGAALKATRLQGILKGASNGTTTLQYIMSDEPVKPGDEVITSGGDRIFPKGLPIGTVASVEPGKDLFLNIRVIPSSRLDRLEEVLVVTKVQEKLPDTKDLGPIRASDILSERLPGLPPTQDTNAAGNAAGAAAGGAANPVPSNSPPGATRVRPGTSSVGAANPTATAGSAKPLPAARPVTPGVGKTNPTTTAADALKPPTGAGSGGSKPGATSATKPGNGNTATTAKPSTVGATGTGGATAKPAAQPPVQAAPDSTPKQPATPPTAGETPPQ